jgi:hypothetical protein
MDARYKIFVVQDDLASLGFNAGVSTVLSRWRHGQCRVLYTDQSEHRSAISVKWPSDVPIDIRIKTVSTRASPGKPEPCQRDQGIECTIFTGPSTVDSRTYSDQGLSFCVLSVTNRVTKRDQSMYNP